jgi:hypothetical protein
MQSILPRRKLGPFTVSSLGLGCMNLSHACGVPPPPDVAVGRTLTPLRSRFTLASKCGVSRTSPCNFAARGQYSRP